MLDIIPIKAFDDNYLWLFHQPGDRQCGIVDPGDASPVLDYLKAHDLELSVILITHHHGDHTGGIKALLEEFDVPVYGPASPNIPAVTESVKEGDHIQVLGESFQVLEIPGHTMDHIAYYASPEHTHDKPVLFCGDTLFAGGCGRVFEGTHSMMHKSLQKLAALPPPTQVFCAHEYTMANLAFASAVSPNSQALAERIETEQAKRNQSVPTVPTSIAVELETNPFLRCEEDDIVEAARQHVDQAINSAEDVFATIRGWKDSF